jgi:hypothetical protein
MSDQPDPVADPDAYRTMLLAALGDEDPAEVQHEALGEIRRFVGEAGDLIGVRPRDGGWSALECLGHLTDGELVVAARVRWILAHDEPEIIGYDQDAWVARLRHGVDDPHALIALFSALRRSNLALWAASSPAERARIGIHNERGPESYDLMFRLAAGHDRIHLAQARAALTEARESLRGSAVA